MRGRPPTAPQEVTERQREVARLVAAGYTNERIAQELGISHDGAKYHVSELLGRLGLERREEIAAWYRAQEAKPAGRAWDRLRSLLGLPAALVAGGVAAVAAVAVLVVAFEGALGGEGPGRAGLPAGTGETVVVERSSEPSAIPVAEYAHEHGDSSAGWETRAVADLEGRDLLFLLYPVFPGMHVELHAIDRATGERAGELVVQHGLEHGPDGELTVATMGGRNALIAHARETRRLIYSDQVSQFRPSAEDPENWFRLLIFDTGDGLALQADLRLPDVRTGTHAGHPWSGDVGYLTLSGDERYLYYLSAESVGVVDLEDGPRLLPAVPLPDGCHREGSPSLYPMGASSVIATCPGPGLIRVISPTGQVDEDIDVGGLAGVYEDVQRPETFEGQPILTLAGVETPIAVIYHEVSFGLVEPSGVLIAGRALPSERPYTYWVWRSEFLRLDESRLAIPYHNHWPFPPEWPPDTPDGFVIFNTETETVEYDVEIEHFGSYPLNEREIALIGEGRLDILDLVTMDIVQSFDTRHPERDELYPVVR